jgi:bile acid:Na+ symporter, BASS family
MTNRTRVLGYTALAGFLLAYIGATWAQRPELAGWLLMGFFLALALLFRSYPKLQGFSYTTMILAAVSLAMYYPQYFTRVGDFRLSGLIVPLLQVIMFGMGAEMNLKEFVKVLKDPRKIAVGVMCQFTIMPLLGFILANSFNFPNEIAAGIILIGVCPSGLASNVMSYLARANLALSIAITTIATLLAPLVTPLLMRLLAGRLIDVNFLDMAWDTTRMIIIPILAGVLFHYLLRGKIRWLDRIMPLISMAGIGLIIVVITAAGRDNLLRVGLLLVLAVALHNLGGYLLGYWASRLIGYPERDCRTISLEVGMQNGGLASGLALLLGGLGTIGLAPAIFGPLMNITGSSLATWWHGRVPKDAGEEISELAKAEM